MAIESQAFRAQCLTHFILMTQQLPVDTTQCLDHQPGMESEHAQNTKVSCHSQHVHDVVHV